MRMKRRCMAIFLLCSFLFSAVEAAAVGPAEAAVSIENINVTGANVTVNGTAEDPDAYVTMVVLKKGGSSSNADDILTVGQKKTDSQGAFSMSFEVPKIYMGEPSDGEYEVVVNLDRSGGDKARTEFLYISSDTRDEFLEILKTKTAAEIEKAISENRAYEKGLMIEGGETERFLALDADKRTALLEEVLEICDRDAMTLSGFAIDFNKMVFFYELNSYENIEENVRALDLEYEEKKFSELSAEEQKFIIEIINRNIPFGSYADLKKGYRTGNIIYKLNTARYSEIDGLMDKYETELDLINDASYKTYLGLLASEKQNVQEGIVKALERAKVYTAAEYKNVLSDAVKAVPTTSGASSVSKNTYTQSAGSENTYVQHITPTGTTADDKVNSGKMVFDDIDGVEWAREAILELAEKGIISGRGENKFDPDGAVTREEFVKIIVKAEGIHDVGAKCEFEDVASGSWYESYVASAVKNGLVTGESSTIFGVGKPITRQDVCVIASRMLKGNTVGRKVTFDDAEDISDYAAESVEAMAAMGIVSGTGDNKFKPKDTCTRAQAAKIISSVMAAQRREADLEEIPADSDAEPVPEENKKLTELSALGILKDMSLVKFESERTVVKKTFYSAIYNIMTDDEESDAALTSFLSLYNINIDEIQFRDKLKREEALTAVVRMLGYSYTAASEEDLLQVAGSVGLRRYVTGDLKEDMTAGEMVDLLYAAISEDMIDTAEITANDSWVYMRLKNVTPLNYYRGIYLVKGCLNKNSYASVVDNTPAPKGCVYIDEEIFLSGISNAGDYIGMPVISYVQYNDDEGTVLYITPNDRYVTVTKIDADKIVSADDRKKSIEYENGTGTKTAKLSSVVKVIFNGKNCAEYTSEELMPDIGSIELIDSDNDRTIDIVNVKSYKTVLVNYVSSYSNTVVSKYEDPAAVRLDSGTDEIIIEKDGHEIELSDIKSNDILLVAQSRSGGDEVIRVLVSDKQVSEKIISADYSGKELGTDSGMYKISQAYIDAMESETLALVKNPDLGKNYRLYLDAFGNVAYAVSQDGKIYLYATRIWQNEGEDTYGIKALDTEGIWKSYEISDKVKWGGENQSITAEAAYAGLNGDSFDPQLLRVDFNPEGKINSIETAASSDKYDEYRFTKYEMNIDRIYTNEGMTFGGDVYGTNDTKVFILPTNKQAGEDEFQLTNMSWFQLDKWYKVEAYDIDKFYRAPLIIYTSDDKKVSNTLYFVKKVSFELEDNEVRTCLECIVNGDEIRLVTASGCDASEVKAGDVIRTTVNAKGEIRYLEVYTHPEENIPEKYPSVTDPTQIHANMAIASGTITDVGIEEGMFLADCGLDNPARFKFLSTTKCYLYDGELKTVSPEDIEPGDSVYVYISYTKVNAVYVIRNVE